MHYLLYRLAFRMRKVFYLFILAFVLNFVWEISQAFLYMPHYVGIAELIKVHFIASLGDVLIISIIFLLSYSIFGFNVLNDKYSIKNLFVVIIIGLVLAILIEKYALATGRWEYNSAMPIIPLLKVGLTPVLQMILIPLTLILFRPQIENKL